MCAGGGPGHGRGRRAAQLTSDAQAVGHAPAAQARLQYKSGRPAAVGAGGERDGDRPAGARVVAAVPRREPAPRLPASCGSVPISSAVGATSHRRRPAARPGTRPPRRRPWRTSHRRPAPRHRSASPRRSRGTASGRASCRRRRQRRTRSRASTYASAGGAGEPLAGLRSVPTRPTSNVVASSGPGADDHAAVG